MNIISAENFAFLFVSISIIGGFVAIANVIYFQIRYQKRVDAIVHGERYIDGGWVFNSTRLMMYAHYCLFTGRRQRDGVVEKIKLTPGIIKFHLVLHWFLVVVGGLFGVLGCLIIKFYL